MIVKILSSLFKTSLVILILSIALSAQPTGKRVSITGNVQQLSKYYNALTESKVKKIRIAHYGDSIIWGDLISNDLREILQKKYGGQGAGFQSIASDDIMAKETTRHSFSNDWEWASLFTRNPQKLTLGVAGTVARSTGSSWTQYVAGTVRSSTKSFRTIRLFYNNANNNCNVTYSLNNGSQQKLKLEAGINVKESVINSSFDATSVKVNFGSCSSTNFFGMSLENGNGVYVDNFSIRGNSGISLADIPKDIYQDFNKLLNYKLIILNFGLNIASPDQSNYTWYKTKMVKVINYLKETFPDAAILMIGVGDKAVKKGTRFQTDPSILQVLKEQKEIADQTGIAFWNLFEAMGGENSMVDWVNQNLGSKDYSHFNGKGGKIVAEMIVEALLSVKH